MYHNLVDWDYWAYLRLVYVDNQLCIRDFNGWLMFSGARTLGMDGVE